MKLSSLLFARHLPRLFSLAMIALLLSACGPGNAQESTEPETDESAASNPAPTAAEGELTVGDLVTDVDAAWSGVTSMRVTSVSGPVPTEKQGGSPVPQGPIAIEEWVAPNNRRLLERVGGIVTNEQVFTNGKVYMWGMFVGTSVAPEVGSGTWVTLDPEVIPPDTPVGYRVTYITREPGSPLGTITPDMRQRPVKESGTVQVGGRSCTLYTFVDTTQLGERIDYELALDSDNLPCQHVMRAGGFQNSSVFEFNNPDIQVIAPDAPTPVSGTPEG
jgi:hypothetical protein